MSAAVEELTRLIHANSYPWCRQPAVQCHCGILAERLLAAGVGEVSSDPVRNIIGTCDQILERIEAGTYRTEQRHMLADFQYLRAEARRALGPSGEATA